MSEKLAKITSASLKIQDRGVFMFLMNVEYEEGLSQGVGGICLDDYDELKNKRVGTAEGCNLIMAILKELGVNDFSEMKGRYIFVIGKGSGFDFKVKGFRSLRVDNKNSSPVIYSDFFKTGKKGK